MIKSDNYITPEIRRAAEQEALATLMSAFTETMFNKLLKKISQGYSGWDSRTPEVIESIKAKLANNINNGDCVDVANLSMMLWNIQQPDGPPTPPAKPPGQ